MRMVHLVADNMFGGMEHLVAVPAKPSPQPQFKTENFQKQVMQSHVAVFFKGLLSDEQRGMGVPVVTSALGGALEIVDETCGLLLPPGGRMRDLEQILKSLIHANPGMPEAEALSRRNPQGATS